MGSPLRIQVQSPDGEHPGRVLALDGPSVVVGRSRAAQVRLPGADVSAAHARLQCVDGALRVEDLGSVNGTRVGAQSLVPGRTYPLDWGAVLHIANYQLTVLDPTTPDPPPALAGEEGTATLAAHLVRDMAGGWDGVRLRVRDPTGIERSVALAPDTRLVLGRDPACTLRLEDPDLSRKHAELCLTPAGATLRDLASKNGITVNGVDWVGSGALHHGDVIRLGGSELWYEDPAEAILAELNRPAPGALSDARSDGPGDAPGPDREGERPDAQDTGHPPGAPNAPIEALETPPPDPPAPRRTDPSKASPGRTGQVLLVALGLALMGAALYLLWWLFV